MREDVNQLVRVSSKYITLCLVSVTSITLACRSSWRCFTSRMAVKSRPSLNWPILIFLMATWRPVDTCVPKCKRSAHDRHDGIPFNVNDLECCRLVGVTYHGRRRRRYPHRPWASFGSVSRLFCFSRRLPRCPWLADGVSVWVSRSRKRSQIHALQFRRCAFPITELFFFFLSPIGRKIIWYLWYKRDYYLHMSVYASKSW